MFFAALLPVVAFGLLALIPLSEGGDETFDEAPERGDFDLPGDGEEDGEADESGDGEDDTGDSDDPTDGGGDDPEAAETTTVTITDADGETREIELTDVEIDGPVDVDGSEERDIFEASLEPTVELQLNGLGGDDAMSFGFGSSADGGEGADVLDLTITEAALAAGELEAGTVALSDVADALAIEIEETAEGFLHEVQITQTTTSDDGNTTTDDVTLFYVLSASEVLTIDEEASATAGAPVVGEGDDILVQIVLGSQTTVTTMGTEGEVETVTGTINDNPTIVLNRDVTSTTEI